MSALPPPLRLLAVALTLSLLWCPSATQSADEDTVHLLNAMYCEGKDGSEARSVWAGMDVAFLNAGYKTENGQRIEILPPTVPSSGASDVGSVVSAVLEQQEKLLAVLGPFSDEGLLAGLSNAEFRKKDLMFLSPYTSADVVRGWSEGVYFTRAQPRAELLVVLSHILNVFRARRIAFMYLTGVPMGSNEYAFTRHVLALLGREPPAVYVVPYDPVSAAVNQSAFDAMASTHPQVVMVWGASGAQVAEFVKALLRDPRTTSAHIMVPSSLRLPIFHTYYALAQQGFISPRNDQVFASATSFPVSHTQANYVVAFRQEMGYYMQRSQWFKNISDDRESGLVLQYGNLSEAVRKGPASDLFLATHPSVAQLMLTGWLGAKLVLETLARPTWTASRAAYKSGLFQQNRYIIGKDYVLGDYGGACEAEAAATGAVCQCNQGGHATYLLALRDASWQLVQGTKFAYSQAQCFPRAKNLYRPVIALTIVFEDYPHLVKAGQVGKQLMPRLLATTVEHNVNVNFASLSVTTTTAQQRFDEYVGDFCLDMVFGPASSFIDVGDMFMPAPLFPRPHLVIEKRNYVYLMPTLEQQMYVLYSNLDEVGAIAGASTTTNVVLRGYLPGNAINITAMLRKTAATFNVPDPTVTSATADAALEAMLKSGVVNFLIGISERDGPVIASFLEANPSAMVVLCFDELSFYYDGLVAALRNVSTFAQARFVSFTNLPLWSDTSAAAHAASPLLAAFHEAVPDAAQHTPLHLRYLAVAGFLKEVFFDTNTVKATTLADTVYRNGVVTSNGITFGRFQWECIPTALEDVCFQANYGAQNIAMLSMHRMLDPSVPVTVAARTPTMTYAPRRQSGLTAAQRSGLVAGCVVGGLALMAAVALLVYCCSDSRDNAAAPKEDHEPVTLIFTDIESSTAMWAALPQVMGDAIASHHRVIRQLIKKHGCYEVKTIGDSFMIACKDAYSAVQLACEVQTRLLEYDWGTTEIDGKYHEFELAKEGSVDDYVPPTARLSKEVYDSMWRGLRVRIGIHTGLADIRYDEVTKGYDYYGDTSNMAARTEAIANGGQVVATEITWWALSDEERAATAHTEFGAQGLRGVPFAVEMYQLNAVPGRKHAALRTEIDAILPDDATETGSSAADALLSSAGTMNGAAASVALVIGGCFAPYPPAQRVRELQPLLNRWNVGAPPRPRQVSEEDYCTGLINRLAVRVANITRVRQNMLGTEQGGEGTSGVGGRMGSNPLGGTHVGGRPQLRPSALADLLSLQGLRSSPRQSLLVLRSLESSPPTQASPPLRRTSRAVVYSPASVDTVVPFSAPRDSLSSREPLRPSSSVEVAEVVEVRLPPELELRQRVGRRDVWDGDHGDA